MSLAGRTKINPFLRLRGEMPQVTVRKSLTEFYCPLSSPAPRDLFSGSSSTPRGALLRTGQSSYRLTNQLDRDAAMQLAVSRFHVAISTAKSSTGVLDPPLLKQEPLIKYDLRLFSCIFGISAWSQKVPSVSATSGRNAASDGEQGTCRV